MNLPIIVRTVPLETRRQKLNVYYRWVGIAYAMRVQISLSVRKHRSLTVALFATVGALLAFGAFGYLAAAAGFVVFAAIADLLLSR